MTDQDVRYTKLHHLAVALTHAIDTFAQQAEEEKLHNPAIFWPQYLLLKDYLDDRTLPPDNNRNVLARVPSCIGKPRTIVAFYGSEGKWCAYDHDGRVTFLEEGTVTDWREIPR